MSESIVIDTNILFSALLKEDSKATGIILNSNHGFFICESTIMELFKHKEKIVRLSQLPEEDLIRLFYILLRNVTVIKEDWIGLTTRRRAYVLCRDTDPADTPFIALTLHLKGRLWTGDKALMAGLREKGFKDFFTP